MNIASATRGFAISLNRCCSDCEIYDKVSDRSEISRRGLANPEADGAREIVERPEPWWRYVNGLRTLRTSVVRCMLPSKSDVSTIYPIFATGARAYENESVRTYGSILATLRDLNESLPSLPFISQWEKFATSEGFGLRGQRIANNIAAISDQKNSARRCTGNCQTRYHHCITFHRPPPADSEEKATLTTVAIRDPFTRC